MNHSFPRSSWSEISNRPRYFWVAAGFVGAASVMALRRYWDQKRAESVGTERESGPTPATKESEPAPAGDAAQASARYETVAPANDDVATEPAASTDTDEKSSEGGARELADFLAGESWFDESGWSSIWEREGVDDAALWLRSRGIEVLRTEREKLTEHPALLAGCRRRWIVVCRYAGIDVGEAAGSWNDSQ